MSGKSKRGRGRPRKTGVLSAQLGEEVANKLIDAIREQTGCNQGELEKRYDLPRSTISDIVTGNGVLSDRTLKLILMNLIRDEEVPVDVRVSIAKMVEKVSVERLIEAEKMLYEHQAEMRRRKFELEEMKLKEEFDRQVLSMAKLLRN